MQYEVIIRDDLKTPKLTIAKDRISLKFPKSLSLEERNRIESFTKNISQNIGEVEFTLRGRFDENGIRLRRKTLSEGDPDSSVYFSYQQFGILTNRYHNPYNYHHETSKT